MEVSKLAVLKLVDPGGQWADCLPLVLSSIDESLDHDPHALMKASITTLMGFAIRNTGRDDKQAFSPDPGTSARRPIIDPELLP